MQVEKSLTAPIRHQNAGIGYHTALAVASRGGRLVMGCRDAGKGQAAREAIMIIMIILMIILIIIIIIIGRPS